MLNAASVYRKGRAARTSSCPFRNADADLPISIGVSVGRSVGAAAAALSLARGPSVGPSVGPARHNAVQTTEWLRCKRLLRLPRLGSPLRRLCSFMIRGRRTATRRTVWSCFEAARESKYFSLKSGERGSLTQSIIHSNSYEFLKNQKPLNKKL